MHSKVWLLSLIPPVRHGRWLSSAAIFGSMYGVFFLLGVFDTGESRPFPAIFFCVILAYIIPIYHYITERSQIELNNLDSILTLDESHRAHVARRISNKPRAWHVYVTCIGLLLGVGHNLILSNDPRELLTPFAMGPVGGASFVTTMTVWLVMTVVLAGLMDNAIVFARLTRRAVIDLLNTAALTPFARVAVSSTLAVIGAQASFPLMLINGDTSPWTYIPGLIATCGPMFLLLLFPVWPIHRAIAAAKRERLRELNHAISQAPVPDLAKPKTLKRLSPLLTLRREIQQVSEWPFDTSVISRLGLYLIIPPLTWVGAALIENLVAGLI